jgi:hypothetical protein
MSFEKFCFNAQIDPNNTQHRSIFDSVNGDPDLAFELITDFMIQSASPSPPISSQTGSQLNRTATTVISSQPQLSQSRTNTIVTTSTSPNGTNILTARLTRPSLPSLAQSNSYSNQTPFASKPVRRLHGDYSDDVVIQNDKRQRLGKRNSNNDSIQQHTQSTQLRQSQLSQLSQQRQHSQHSQRDENNKRMYDHQRQLLQSLPNPPNLSQSSSITIASIHENDAAIDTINDHLLKQALSLSAIEANVHLPTDPVPPGAVITSTSPPVFVEINFDSTLYKDVIVAARNPAMPNVLIMGNACQSATDFYAGTFPNLNSTTQIVTKQIPPARISLSPQIFSSLNPWKFLSKCVQQGKWAFLFYSPPPPATGLASAAIANLTFNLPQIIQLLTPAWTEGDFGRYPPSREEKDIKYVIPTHFTTPPPPSGKFAGLETSGLTSQVAVLHIQADLSVYNYYHHCYHHPFSGTITQNTQPFMIILDPYTHVELISYNSSIVIFNEPYIMYSPLFQWFLQYSLLKFSDQPKSQRVAIEPNEINQCHLDVSNFDPIHVVYAMIRLANFIQRVPCISPFLPNVDPIRNPARHQPLTRFNSNSIFTRCQTTIKLQSDELFKTAQARYVARYKKHIALTNANDQTPPRKFHHLLCSVSFLQQFNLTKAFLEELPDDLIHLFDPIISGPNFVEPFNAIRNEVLKERQNYRELMSINQQDQKTDSNSNFSNSSNSSNSSFGPNNIQYDNTQVIDSQMGDHSDHDHHPPAQKPRLIFDHAKTNEERQIEFDNAILYPKITGNGIPLGHAGSMNELVSRSTPTELAMSDQNQPPHSRRINHALISQRKKNNSMNDD